MILVNEKHMLLWSEANSGGEEGGRVGGACSPYFLQSFVFFVFFFLFLFSITLKNYKLCYSKLN